METFWDTLGIKPTTDTKKIRKAYSALVKVHNPEDDEEQFKKINGAYKAAMKFAASFEKLNVSDEQIVITDVRSDGSFGVKFLDKDGKPLFPTPPAALPDKEPSADMPEHISDKKFDFDSIDSSVVKAYTYEEASERAGMIMFAKGFAVPDSETTRSIKKFLDDNDLVNILGRKPDPGKEKEASKEALRIAELIVDNDLSAQKVIWQFYFLSPLVTSLRTDLDFYTDLEKYINGKQLPFRNLYAISESSGFHPKVVNLVKKDPKTDPCVIDFRSRVPFRYVKGKYPDLENMMKRAKPDEFKQLTDFLSKVPVNIYGILMPYFRPDTKASVVDASYVFDYLTSDPRCKEIKDNRLMWRLYFGSRLVKPIIKNPDLYAALKKQVDDKKLPKPFLKMINKEVKPLVTDSGYFVRMFALSAISILLFLVVILLGATIFV